MDNIIDYINLMCPTGIEFRPLLDVANVLYGFPCDASKFNESDGRPLARIRNVLDGVTDTYTQEEIPDKYTLIKGDLLVGMDGNFHVGKWQMDDGILCQRVCKFESNDNEETILNGWLSHILPPIMKNIENKKPSGTVKHLLDRDIQSIEIPVPPLPIQEEIVRILDKFTELEAELESELESELEMRKKQYAYYRDKLISLEDYDGEVEWKPLSKVAKRLKGSPVTAGQMKKMAVEGGNITIFGGGATKVQTDEKHTSKFNIITVPSVLVKSRGIVDVEYCDFPYTFKQEMWAYQGLKDIDTKFLYYYLQTKVDMLRYKGSKMGSMPQIKLDDTETIMVPIIDINEQKRIVDILDKFSTLTSDISKGLPAEIKMRYQQYEYYRDKLLTFERI